MIVEGRIQLKRDRRMGQFYVHLGHGDKSYDVLIDIRVGRQDARLDQES